MVGWNCGSPTRVQGRQQEGEALVMDESLIRCEFTHDMHVNGKAGKSWVEGSHFHRGRHEL